MEGFSSKVNIGLLEGKSNWTTWKYKISVLLRGTEGAMDVVQGIIKRPESQVDCEGVAEVASYNKALAEFKKADCSALLIIASNLSEETLQKVIRFESAYEVWTELHRLFDGDTEDKAYSHCMEFFSYKRSLNDDVSTHMSKLKNIWNNLNVAIMKNDLNAKLPDLFLICKILETLDERFFAFKSSWLLLNMKDRTVDNLTTQLCCFEKALLEKEGPSQETLVTQKNSFKKKKEYVKCNYCGILGHKVRKCKKWLKDGKPPKPNSNSESQSKQVQNVTLMAVNVCTNYVDKENWYVDNGATTHIATKRDVFQEFKKFDSDHTVTTANGSVIPAIGKGLVMVECKVNNKMEIIHLKDVWLVPTLTKNLFSTLAAQDNVRNSLFTSTATHCQLDIEGVTMIVGKRDPGGGLYKLQMRSIPSKITNSIEVNALTGTNLLQIYHERYAHQDKRHVRALVKREFGINLPADEVKCEACVFGKAHRTPFGKRERASTPGEIIHTDVCGPFEHPSVSKYRYYVLFKDDYSSYRTVFFMWQKSEVVDKLRIFLNEVKTTGHTVKTLLADNGGEFDNKRVKNLLYDYGIKLRLTMPYTPQQNGCSERENRTLVEAARTWLHARNLPQKLWAELINTAAYVLNRTGPTKVTDRVPYELWFNSKPKISHLRIIGSNCYTHIPKQCRKKLSKKAIKGILIGYENNDGYRVWDGIKINRSRDIIFASENEFKFSINPLSIKTNESEGDNPKEIIGPIDEHILTEQNLEGEEPTYQDDVIETNQDDIVDEITDNVREDITNQNSADMEEFVDAEDHMELDVDEESIEPRYNLRDRSTLKRPLKFEDFACLVDAEKIPDSYNEVMKSNNKIEWLKAMNSEMKSLKENKVWTLCELPPNRKALPCKWVFRIKRHTDGTIDKYKARLVVKGFKQRKGLDYDQTFSPVARLTTIRALLSVSAQEKLHLRQFDVSTAFLNAKLNEEIYMKQPDGFISDSTKVCRLNRSLYGLKQAPRCWNSCFEEILIDMGFTQCESDCCLFKKNVGEKKILITLYVDDGLVATSDIELANSFLEDLKSNLKITSKPISNYLGLEINQLNNGSVIIKQESYTRKVLQRFKMLDCNPVSTPIIKESNIGEGKVETNLHNSTTEKGKVETNFPYREAVGSLAYLMVASRPDIAFAVGVVSRKLENPRLADWYKVKRIFRYLKGTINYGITYKANTRLQGYSDADHAGDADTGRSTSGVLCLYAGGAISWLSQRQATVSISTTEAEIVAASEGARELVWLKRLYRDLATGTELVPELHIDNEAAIRLAHNPEFHKRTKHIKVRHFFVREVVQQGEITIRKTSSSEQLADILTKPLPKPRLLILLDKMGVTT